MSNLPVYNFQIGDVVKLKPTAWGIIDRSVGLNEYGTLQAITGSSIVVKFSNWPQYHDSIDQIELGSRPANPAGSAPARFQVGDLVKCTSAVTPVPYSAGWESGKEFVVTNITLDSGLGYVYWPTANSANPDLGVFECHLEPETVNNQGDSKVPKTKLLKKDVEVGMRFSTITQINFRHGSKPVPQDTPATVVQADGRGIWLEFEGWNGGSDLDGLLPNNSSAGYLVIMDELNAWFAVLTPVKIDFDSVILAEHKKEQIIHALKQIDHHDLIFKVWGFEKTFEKGRGISMLFYGPPGTGKTLMAQAIAHKLDYKLKIISSADIQSSVPGEAERNIRKHFKEAGNGKSILLFDECDSLIHTRQSVGAILGAQINELLSQLERFEGITVFTTNRLGTLDEAVNRRLSIKVEFSMPDAKERVRIWQRMFPQEVPLDKDINWKKLAKEEIAGGHIKNAVLRAAREAATADMPDKQKTIKMEHLAKGLKAEVESNEAFKKAKKGYDRRYIPGGGLGLDADSGGNALSNSKNELKKVRESVESMKNG